MYLVNPAVRGSDYLPDIIDGKAKIFLLILSVRCGRCLQRRGGDILGGDLDAAEQQRGNGDLGEFIQEEEE